MPTYRYTICGLTIEFPWEVSAFDVSQQTPDVSVKFGLTYAPAKDSINYDGPFCQVARNHVLFSIENIANFMICDGTTITIEPCDEADIDSLNVFVLGSCLGVLLIQRGLLVLHAAVLEKNGIAVAFGGGPGCGKSTLSALLLQSGAQVMTDNLASVYIDDPSGVAVSPSFPYIHLWQSTLERLDLSAYDHKKLRPELNKLAVVLGSEFISNSRPLRTLCVLDPWNKSEICLEKIEGPERIMQLANVSFRMKIVRGLELDSQHFKQMGALSQMIKLVKLSYPQDWDLNGKLIDYLDEHLFK